jgi:hypothetical protein
MVILDGMEKAKDTASGFMILLAGKLMAVIKVCRL